MRKFLLTLCFLCLIPITAFAGVQQINLNTAANVRIEDLSLTSGVAVFTGAIDTKNSSDTGRMTLLITEDQSGGTGDVDITIEFSNNGTTWFTDQSRTDELGAFVARVIAVGVQNEAIAITFTHAPAKFLRIKFDPDANSEITATLIFDR